MGPPVPEPADATRTACSAAALQARQRRGQRWSKRWRRCGRDSGVARRVTLVRRGMPGAAEVSPVTLEKLLRAVARGLGCGRDLRSLCVVARLLRGQPEVGLNRREIVAPRPRSGRLSLFHRHFEKSVCSRRQSGVTTDNTIGLFAGTFTGATGLEPATSGVTGRSCRFRPGRGIRGDFRREQVLPTLTFRGLPGIGGSFRRLPAGYLRDAALSQLSTTGWRRDRAEATGSVRRRARVESGWARGHSG